MTRDVRALERALSTHDPVVLACTPTLEGVLSAVGVSYLAHAPEGQVRLCASQNLQTRLGEQACDVTCDVDLARRVYVGFQGTVARGCSRASGGSCSGGCTGGCVRRLAYAAACEDADMPEALHRYVRLGFSVGPRVRNRLSDPVVVRLDDLARSAMNECERMRQFVRLSRLSDGSFIAVFSPKADVVPLTGSYFAARLAGERFCIVDPRHLVACFHDARQGLAYLRLSPADTAQLVGRDDLAPDERYVRAMWKRFYDGLALPGRDATHRGYDLRAQLMPKRFWPGLTELDPASDDPGELVPAAYRGSTKTEEGPRLPTESLL